MKYTPSTPQRMAYDHLMSHDNAALFMGCGLGKTAAALHAQADLMFDGLSKGALIVAPLRVCNLTWPAEVEKWDAIRPLGIHNLRTKEGTDALRAGENGLYVVNYELLRACAGRWKDMRELPFDTVIFDELTRAKNHRSVNINALRPIIRKHCKRRWGLTGTPAPNGLMDLFAQIRLLDDGQCLGPSYDAFKRCYFKQDDYMGYSWSPKPESRRKIYTKISDLALTLKSSDWLDIPDTIIEDVAVSLPKESEEGYRTLEKDLLLPLKNGDDISAANAAVLVNKLLQYTSGAVYDEERAWHQMHTAKLDALRKLIKSFKGESVIVFYQFKHELERMLALKDELGVVSFSEANTQKKQEALVRRWNSGKIRVLAAHPKSMAHGLNMQEGGRTVVWLSPTWSREDYDQAIARVARRGQDKVTQVYRLLSPETVDDAIVEALRGKDEEQGALLDALRRYASGPSSSSV